MVRMVSWVRLVRFKLRSVFGFMMRFMLINFSFVFVSLFGVSGLFLSNSFVIIVLNIVVVLFRIDVRLLLIWFCF